MRRLRPLRRLARAPAEPGAGRANVLRPPPPPRRSPGSALAPLSGRPPGGRVNGKPKRQGLLGELICPEDRCGEPEPPPGLTAILDLSMAWGAANAETRSISSQQRGSGQPPRGTPQRERRGSARTTGGARPAARDQVIARRMARLDRLEAAGGSDRTSTSDTSSRELPRPRRNRAVFAVVSALEQTGFAAGYLELHDLAGRAADLVLGPDPGRAPRRGRSRCAPRKVGPRASDFGARWSAAYQAALANLEALRVAPPSERNNDETFTTPRSSWLRGRSSPWGPPQGVLAAAVRGGRLLPGGRDRLACPRRARSPARGAGLFPTAADGARHDGRCEQSPRARSSAARGAS